MMEDQFYNWFMITTTLLRVVRLMTAKHSGWSLWPLQSMLIIHSLAEQNFLFSFTQIKGKTDLYAINFSSCIQAKTYSSSSSLPHTNTHTHTWRVSMHFTTLKYLNTLTLSHESINLAEGDWCNFCFHLTISMFLFTPSHPGWAMNETHMHTHCNIVTYTHVHIYTRTNAPAT